MEEKRGIKKEGNSEGKKKINMVAQSSQKIRKTKPSFAVGRKRGDNPKQQYQIEKVF